MKPDEESNEEGEDEEKEGDPDEPEPEVGPLLLTPLSQDGGIPLLKSLTAYHQPTKVKPKNVWIRIQNEKKT